ncbi:MAG: DUF6265 family protein [Gemmatimonadetes bacterium]|nr:DUF6265 family protein [Gemmatimonadota bacterium]
MRIAVVVAGFALGMSVEAWRMQPSDAGWGARYKAADATFAGTWIRETARGELTERWTRVSDETMEGLGFAGAAGSKRVSEHLRIEMMGGEIFYVAKPTENAMPTPFKLGAAGDGRFVFTNPDHDFPQTIVYTRRGERGLLVRIEGSEGGVMRSVDFNFLKKPPTP